jgi:hypothetical protein
VPEFPRRTRRNLQERSCANANNLNKVCDAQPRFASSHSVHHPEELGGWFKGISPGVVVGIPTLLQALWSTQRGCIDLVLKGGALLLRLAHP